MTIPIEPPLGQKSPAVLQRRFRQVFGGSITPADPPSRRYRLLVAATLRRQFGTPTPPGLYSLIDEAGRVGVEPDALVDFIGRQFKLTPLQHASS